MAYRGLLWVGCAVGLVIACSGDPAKKVVMSDEAGAGGEAGANGSGGSQLTPSAGMPGVEGGAGGDAPLPAEAGAPSGGTAPEAPGGAGAGGEPMLSSGGAGADQGGAPSAGAGGVPSIDPNVSQCGVGLYDDVEDGCVACPALPDPNYPTALDCSNYSGASYDSYTHTLELTFTPYIHEGFAGTVAVSWTDEDLSTGSGQYEWYFDNDSQTVRILVLDAPTTAQAFSVTYLTVQDACGFSFFSSSLQVYFNVETWSCGVPQQSACGVGYYESGADGCATCPALPEPNDPVALGCGNFDSASYNWYDGWLDVTFDAGVHEAFDGQAHIGWQDDTQQVGEGDYSWFYDPTSQTFRFAMPDVPDNAQEFFIESWSFTDACGFPFEIGDMVKVYYDGDGGWGLDCGG